jgi:hypothetical protein
VWKHMRFMWIHLAPLKRAPTAQVGQTGLFSSSSSYNTLIICLMNYDIVILHAYGLEEPVFPSCPARWLAP